MDQIDLASCNKVVYQKYRHTQIYIQKKSAQIILPSQETYSLYIVNMIVLRSPPDSAYDNAKAALFSSCLVLMGKPFRTKKLLN